MKNILVLASALGFLALNAAAADDAQLQSGKQLYEYWCATCHGSGAGHPGTQALDAKYKGAKPGVLDERTDLPPVVLKAFVRKGVSIMPFFRKTELTDAQLDAVAAYVARSKVAK